MNLQNSDCQALSGNNHSSAHCPDCPAVRGNVLMDLVDRPDGCSMRSMTLEPRQVIPMHWFSRYQVGMVRRGILIRQRCDADGRSTAVDVVGTGCLFPVRLGTAIATGDNTPAGYAVTRSLVCLASEQAVESSFVEGGSSARDVHRRGERARRDEFAVLAHCERRVREGELEHHAVLAGPKPQPAARLVGC